ncbi:MAG: hypothetical protein WC568_05420 [Candidatus Methanoperedens sp.]
MNDAEPPIIPVEPNPFWRENAKKLVGESISTIEDVAKQLIAVNALLEGIYFHAIAFSDVKPLLTGWSAGVYLAPILLWLLSLVFAVLTLSPKAYAININSSRDSKERFEEIVAKKHGMLKISELFLILSFIALFAAVAHYLLAVPKV